MTKEEKNDLSVVLDLIDNYCTEEEKNKISKGFYKFLKKNGNPEYESKIDYTKEIKDLELSNDVKGYLSLIYLDYLADENEKSEFKKILLDNDNKIFEKKAIYEKEVSELPIEISDEKWYIKIVNRVKNIFNKLFCKQ